MSYEGYEQVICKNGHLWKNCDIYADLAFDASGPHSDSGLLKCPVCKEKAVFVNPVDETNGPPQGRIEDWKPFEISPERVEVCNFGHEHVVERARYRVPTEKELRTARKYYDE